MLASGSPSGRREAADAVKSPKKGILKKQSVEEVSFDSPRVSSAGAEKSARWDEMNILQTYHPPDKDYGHMKIDEPKTPYNYTDAHEDSEAAIHAEDIQRRLEQGEPLTRLHGSHVSLSSEDDSEVNETPEHKAHRIQFEEHRRKHYNEGHLLKNAKKLVEEELKRLEAEEGGAPKDESMDVDSPQRQSKVTSSRSDRQTTV